MEALTKKGAKLYVTVGFYDPKSRVSTRGNHAARARACQDEGAPSREGTEKWHGRAMWQGWLCHVLFRRPFGLAARVCPGGSFLPDG